MSNQKDEYENVIPDQSQFNPQERTTESNFYPLISDDKALDKWSSVEENKKNEGNESSVFNDSMY